jgi:hypothetical protein
VLKVRRAQARLFILHLANTGKNNGQKNNIFGRRQ